MPMSFPPSTSSGSGTSSYSSSGGNFLGAPAVGLVPGYTMTGSTSTGALAAGTAWGIPFILHAPTVFTQGVINPSGAASARVAIYKFTSASLTSAATLAVDFGAITATNGWTFSTATNVTLQPGFYLTALAVTGSPTLNRYPAAPTEGLFMSGTGTTANVIQTVSWAETNSVTNGFASTITAGALTAGTIAMTGTTGMPYHYSLFVYG